LLDHKIIFRLQFCPYTHTTMPTMPTMPESINQMPFVCKWLYSHSEPQHFETQEELRNHIDKHDINSCNRSSLGYIHSRAKSLGLPLRSAINNI
jgi:hypothetical protein